SRPKCPYRVEASQWTGLGLDHNTAILPIECIPAANRFAKNSPCHRHIRNDQLVVAAFPTRHNDVLLAVWDEFGITLDIDDQVEHLLRAVIYVALGMNGRH